ncbi:ABC transporter [Carnobacterium divergens]|uniref:ABC transporter permease n=1 Tax=Carnobacterium divergens TaxID=2748 RepID=UPI0010724213|nr:ABC transporter permease [Carnobacterium divergens]MDT1996924.1 ABC transporter permease [Carnobacterium divergens]TFI64920.1 ABC transporter [Carnobacterium divergens]TFI65013.1 ABC transporter [Carnobacterium divergens]TFI68199.1 ABC transporter [Carnobacterium divergens]TFI80204.1 ABC transporter [Carnobacterium divergens]
MNMIEIWKKRVRLHQKKMMRYMKYVFNDHFVLVCLFLIGALGYAYSNFLKSLAGDFIWGRPIVLVIFVLLILTGKLATLIQPADAVFLLPKEEQMKDYFKGAKMYSSLLPSFIIVLITAFLMPLLVATTTLTFFDMVYFIVMLLMLKNWELDLQIYALKVSQKQERHLLTLIKVVTVAILSGISLFIYPIIGVALAILVSIGSRNWLSKKGSHQVYQWEWMVSSEQQRMHRIYQFINLFTDIPSLKGKVRRRKYLDGFLKGIKPVHQKTFDYLYARTFLRGTEYSGLFIRLTGIAAILIVVTHSFYVGLFLAVIFIYLTGFQLLPLYFHYDNMALTNLYPVKETVKTGALKRLLMMILLCQSVIIVIASLLVLSITESLLMGIVALVFSVVFCQFYLPSRIKKMKLAKRY